jgi:hypothetical protein
MRAERIWPPVKNGGILLCQLTSESMERIGHISRIGHAWITCNKIKAQPILFTEFCEQTPEFRVSGALADLCMKLSDIRATLQEIRVYRSRLLAKTFCTIKTARWIVDQAEIFGRLRGRDRT